MKKTFEDKEFIFEYDENLELVVLQARKMINYQRILGIFNLNKFRKVKVNLFDNQENFVLYLKNIRGEAAFIPQYCSGAFDKNEVNLSLDSNKREIQNACKIFHELVHIIYKETFYKENKKRVLWFDEGLAQCISGEKKYNLTKEEMKEFIQNKILPNQISDISFLNKHGNNFVSKNYNGYDLSFLCVRYLLDTLNEKKFFELIENVNNVIAINKDIIIEAYSYYLSK